MLSRICPPDTSNDVFVLYDPIDADHQEEVTLERIRGLMQIGNDGTDSTNGGVRVSWGIYLATRNAAGAMTSGIDPRGVTAFDIEANWTLLTESVQMNAAIAGQQTPQTFSRIDVKGRRKIQDPRFLALVINSDIANRACFKFQARCLMREGRF